MACLLCSHDPQLASFLSPPSAPSSSLTGSHHYRPFADEETEVGNWRAEFKPLVGQVAASTLGKGSPCTTSAS